MFKLTEYCKPEGEVGFYFWKNDSDVNSQYVGFIGKILHKRGNTVTFDVGTLIFRYPEYNGPLEVKISQKQFDCECVDNGIEIFDNELYILNVGQKSPALKQDVEHYFTKRDAETERQLKAYEKSLELKKEREK